MPIYFLRAGRNGPVKIGYTRNIKERVKNLQTCHYEELILVRDIDGGTSIESALHRHFLRLHIRGEWFHWDQSMLTYIPNPEQGRIGRLPRQRRGEYFPASLDTFMRDNGVTVSDLADAIGVTGPHRIRTVYRYLKHERTPALPVIQRISEFTAGKVTFNDFLPTKEPANA